MVYYSLARQVGGNHYKQYKIEPVVYITKNRLSYSMGNIVKYASRIDTRDHLQLNELKLKVKDLQKISHYAEIATELAIEEYEEAHGTLPDNWADTDENPDAFGSRNNMESVDRAPKRGAG